MGIRFFCPNGHKLNVKGFLAGRRGICPFCGVSVQIPTESIPPNSQQARPKSGKPAAKPGPDPRTQASASAEAPTEPESPPETSPEVPPPDTATWGPEQSLPLVSPTPTPPAAAQPPAESPQPPQSPQPQPSAAAPKQPPALPPTPSAPAVSPHPSAAKGPLDEAPDAVWYVRPTSGGQFGPATADVMRSWLDEGRVVAGTLVWREGWRDWQEASTVFAELAADRERAALSEIASSATSSGRHAAGTHRPLVRRRSNTTNVAVIVVLLLAVIVLLIVFYYVVISPPRWASSALGHAARTIAAADAGCGFATSPAAASPLANQVPQGPGGLRTVKT